MSSAGRDRINPLTTRQFNRAVHAAALLSVSGRQWLTWKSLASIPVVARMFSSTKRVGDHGPD
jgi:hypothetical protein